MTNVDIIKECICLMTNVARVRRRGDRPAHSCVYLENIGRQGIIVFY
jgi:hypothetical protein